MQVGKAAGAVKVVNVNRQGDVTHQHVQLHQHFYAAPLATSAPAPAAGVPAPVPQRAAQPVSDGHREVLALMEPLPKRARIRVLEFMGREFGTSMVIQLTDIEVFRTRRYVEAIVKGSSAKGRSSAHH